jgi:Mg2+ and Co2+ transporter CorA
MRELTVDNREFFKEVPVQLNNIQSLVDEELIKPTTSLTDLMYKSVEIRDSRHELRLGTSMWRLSWITFIFLPLTFMVGFFGMNTSVFQPDPGYPSIKWLACPNFRTS